MAINKQNLRNFLILFFWFAVFLVGLFVAIKINDRVDDVKKNLDLISQTQDKKPDTGQNSAGNDDLVSDSKGQFVSRPDVQWKQYRNYEFDFAFDYPEKFQLGGGATNENGEFYLELYPDSNSEVAVSVTKASLESFEAMGQSQMYMKDELRGLGVISASGYYKEYFFRTFRFLGEDYEFEFVYKDDRIKIDVLNQFEDKVEGHILEAEVDKVNENLELFGEMMNSFYLIEDEKND